MDITPEKQHSTKYPTLAALAAAIAVSTPAMAAELKEDQPPKLEPIRMRLGGVMVSDPSDSQDRSKITVKAPKDGKATRPRQEGQRLPGKQAPRPRRTPPKPRPQEQQQPQGAPPAPRPE